MESTEKTLKRHFPELEKLVEEKYIRRVISPHGDLVLYWKEKK